MPTDTLLTPGLVTAVITAYNKGPYLAEAIDSALRQDYRPLEIVVVDDGSTDDTGRVAQSFGDRVRYLWQSNQGPSGAKNRGVLEGRGEFIAFLDGDDRWCEGKLTRQIHLFEGRPEVGVVYCDRVLLAGGQDPVAEPAANRARFHRGRVLDQMLVDNFVPFSGAVARRAGLLEAGLFDEAIRVADDYDLWLRMARLCEFDYVAEVLVEYRVGIDSIGGRVGCMFDHVMAIQQHFVERFYQGRYPQPRVVRRATALKHAARADRSLAAGRHWKALGDYWTALRHDPWSLCRYAALLRGMVPNPIARRLKGALLGPGKRTKAKS